jgi:DNA-binding beta-propeller fold protein YncE
LLRACYDAGLESKLKFHSHLVSRRSFLSVASVLAACGPKRAPRYEAWLFIASASENAVVVADLSSFRRTGAIGLGAAPDQVVSARGVVFAVCNDSQSIVRIDPVRQVITGRISIGGKISGAALTTGGDFLVVATSQPSSLVLIDVVKGAIARQVSLPGAPTGIDAAGAQVAVLLASGSGKTPSASVARVNIVDGRLLGSSLIGPGVLTALGYRRDGRAIFVAATDARQIVTLDSDTGNILARLPVPIRPARFCTDGTGGQVFVTGADREDQLVILSPYQNQVDQSLYGGRSPYGMAVAPARNLLFLTNPEAGGVTIVAIETRAVAASIRTGGKPIEVLVASENGSDEEYAFVVDGETGDVSVIHIPTVLKRGGDTLIAEPPKPLFAVFHGGQAPRSAVIVNYPG